MPHVLMRERSLAPAQFFYGAHSMGASDVQHERVVARALFDFVDQRGPRINYLSTPLFVMRKRSLASAPISLWRPLHGRQRRST